MLYGFLQEMLPLNGIWFLQEMVDWFNAIRAARFHYLQVAFPGASDEEVRADLWIIAVEEKKRHLFVLINIHDTKKKRPVCPQLVPKLTRNFMKEGFMEKTGPKVCALCLSRGYGALKRKQCVLAKHFIHCTKTVSHCKRETLCSLMH